MKDKKDIPVQNAQRSTLNAPRALSNALRSTLNALRAAAAPLPAAVAHLAGKAIVPSILRSADWAEIPAQLRERSQFSAGVESAKFLQTVQDKLLHVVQMRRESVARGEAFVDRSSFIADLRQVAREEGIGTGAGNLQDVQSSARLGLIYDMQTKQAANFATWKMDQNQDILDAFPAQELLRVEERRAPRDWTARWTAAGGSLAPHRSLSDGGMIALKDDPIWTAISIFGTPWPPFDWGSGMGLRNVSRQAAIDLGLLDPGERVAPDDTGFNDNLEIDATTIAPAFLDALANLFGPLVKIAEGKITWMGA